MKDIHLLILRKIKLSKGILEPLLIEFMQDFPQEITTQLRNDSVYSTLFRLRQLNLISIERSSESPTSKVIKLTDKGQEYLKIIHDLYSPSLTPEKDERSQNKPTIIKDSGLNESLLETISSELKIDNDRSVKILNILMRDIRAFLKRNNIFLYSKWSQLPAKSLK